MTIYEQLIAYCDCVDAKEEDIDELISLISMATCWSQEPCETFLNSLREEVIDIDDCLCDCEIIKFAPFYSPFDKNSFTFTLVKQEGINETFIPIEEVAYSEVEGVFKLIPPLPNCHCMNDGCSCNPDYKLLVRYIAGYDLLPECLLPVFCEGLQYIIERRKCDCSECQECLNYDDDRVEVLIANAATITNQLKAFFVSTLSKQYMRQLAQISLCQSRKKLWGVVV